MVGHGTSKIAKTTMSQGSVRTISRSGRVLSIPRPPDLARASDTDTAFSRPLPWLSCHLVMV
jgi:hypothetical protein